MSKRSVLILIFIAFVLGFTAHMVALPFYASQGLFAASIFERWFPSLYFGQKLFSIEMSLLDEYKKGDIQINFVTVSKGVQATFTSDKPELITPIKNAAADIEDILKKLKQ